MLILLIVFAVLLLYYAYFRHTRRHLYELSKVIPYVEGHIPILGHTHRFIGGPEKMLKNIEKCCHETELCGGLSQIWIGPSLYVAVMNPEDVSKVLENCLQKDSSYRFLQVWLGNGLFVAPVDLWKIHRRAMLPIFNNKIIDNFIEVFAKHGAVLVERLAEDQSNGNEFDVCKYVTSCLLDIVFETAMGEKMDIQRKPNNPYLNARATVMSIINMRLFKAWLQPDAIFNLTSYSKTQQKSIDITHEFTDEIIKKKRKLKETTPHDIDNNLDLLDLLLRREIKFSDEELRQHIDSITIAGNDTTSLVISYALVLLGSHQDEQERVYKELENIFGTDARLPTKEDLNQMHCLERVIKETMRLYTVVPVIARQTQSELKLSTCTIPPGVGCAVVPHVLHRSKIIWGPDADNFNPDRFLPEHAATRHPCAFIPFSHGARNCIGRHFGMMAMKSVLANVLRSYKIKSEIKNCDRLKIEILLFPVSGHIITIEKRC